MYVHMCGEIIAGHEEVLSFPDNLIQFHARENPKEVDESQFSVNMTTQGIQIWYWRQFETFLD